MERLSTENLSSTRPSVIMELALETELKKVSLGYD
jgi:hypothetical protein